MELLDIIYDAPAEGIGAGIQVWVKPGGDYNVGRN